MHGPDAAVVYAFLVAGLRGQQGVECSEGSEDLFRVLFAAEACGFPSIESSQRTSPFFDLHFQLASIFGHESSIRCCSDGGKSKGSQSREQKAVESQEAAFWACFGFFETLAGYACKLRG